MDFILTCLASLAFYAGYYFFLPTLPVHLTHIGMSTAEVGVVIGAFTITAAVSRPITGMLADRGWAKIVGVVGTAGVIAVSAGFNVARTLAAFVALRLVHGWMFASFTSTSGVFAANVMPASRRGEAMGYYSVAQAIGMSLGPVAATFLMEGSGFGIVSVGAIAFLTCSLVLTSRISKVASKPPQVVDRKIVLFSRHALQPFILAFASMVAWGGMLSYLALLVYDRHIGNPGSFFTTYAVVLIATRALGGRASDRFGRSVGIYAGTTTVAIGLLVLAFSTSLVTLLIAAVLYGIGQGFSQPAFLALTVDKAPAAERGQALSTVYLGMDLGVTIGAVALGPVIQVAGFGAGFACAAGFMLLGSLVFGVLQTMGRRGVAAAP